ncbi:MAG: stage V sporulation protein AA, partial [Anaerotignum sp.]|nr:stage V sporulation protein AA [Anaerotignum sp.]
MDIYIKPVGKIQIVQKRNVLMKDVAELFIDGKAKSEAESLSVFHIPSDDKKTYLITVLDLIQILRREYTDAVVNNVGEKDILIEYLPRAEGRSVLWT